MKLSPAMEEMISSRLCPRPRQAGACPHDHAGGVALFDVAATVGVLMLVFRLTGVLAVWRALGARVGRRVHIHRGVNLQQGGWDLLAMSRYGNITSIAGLYTAGGGLRAVGGGALIRAPTEAEVVLAVGIE